VAVVVDASAMAAIVFGEPEGRALSAHLRGQTLLAPALIDYEMANIAVTKSKRRPEHRPLHEAALERYSALGLTRVAVSAADACRIASETGLTAYDAAYLWVAASRDAELVTLDDDLARAAGNI
jgi:predicted nucleic acid-binding protein